MDRSQISSWTPPEIAERAADRGVEEYSPEDLKEARLEIVDAILGTEKGWRGTRLWHVLEEFLNVDGPVYAARLAEIGKHLQHMLGGDEADRPAPVSDRLSMARADAHIWLHGLVEAYVKQEWVEARAVEIAGERLELAS